MCVSSNQTILVFLVVAVKSNDREVKILFNHPKKSNSFCFKAMMAEVQIKVVSVPKENKKTGHCSFAYVYSLIGMQI